MENNTIVYNVKKIIWSMKKTSGKMKSANVISARKSAEEFLLRFLIFSTK